MNQLEHIYNFKHYTIICRLYVLIYCIKHKNALLSLVMIPLYFDFKVVYNQIKFKSSYNKGESYHKRRIISYHEN